MSQFAPLPSATAISVSDLELKITIAQAKDLAARFGKDVYIVPEWDKRTRHLNLRISPHEHLVEGCIRVMPDGYMDMCTFA